MQSVRLHRMGTYLSLAVLVLPVIMAGIADLQDAGAALGVPADFYIKLPLLGAVMLTVLKGAQAVVTIATQTVPEEGSSRNGLATYVNLGLLVLPVVGATVMAIRDDAVMLGASPKMFIIAAAVGAVLGGLLKGAQAVVEIVVQKRWEAIEEPVPTEGGANEPVV